MRAGPAYLAASLCLGWIAVWAGENFFWSTPDPGLRRTDLAFTWAVYSLAAAAALSAAIWARLGGWRAAFLGGALLGFQIEGAVVATMYEAFPAQLVWTPLAWHALISGLAVLGGGLALARGGVARQVAGCLALGVFGAVWSLYWPLEGKPLAGLPALLVYLGLAGAGAAAALALLSRLTVPDGGRWWLWIAPGAMAALWVLGTVFAPSPLRLAGPAMVLATLWAMRRLGRGGAGPRFGPPLPWTRALLLTLAPVTTALLVAPAWATFGGQPVNVPIALATGVISLALWLGLLVAAARVRP
jgi:hypothetical protein